MRNLGAWVDTISRSSQSSAPTSSRTSTASLQRYVQRLSFPCASSRSLWMRTVIYISCQLHVSDSLQRIYSVLARHGRQTLAAIAKASYLNGRQIKYGLVILLQQHLVFHSGNNSELTYYEIDWQNSYALVRVGKVT